MKRVLMEVSPGGKWRPWKVTREGDTAGECDTQTDALALAKVLVKLQLEQGKTVTLKIKRPNGSIREERTYPRSSDPSRTKG